jgi:hypothetical protein
MRIKLHFPEQSIATIQAMGLRQTNPETLRLVTDHPASSYGIGVLLRGKSGDILDGSQFAELHYSFGVWVECDSVKTIQRVRNALVTAASGMDEQIKASHLHPWQLLPNKTGNLE